MALKDYALEHTKRIFNEQKIMSLQNLNYYYILVELYRMLKYDTKLSVLKVCSNFVQKIAIFSHATFSPRLFTLELLPNANKGATFYPLLMRTTDYCKICYYEL